MSLENKIHGFTAWVNLRLAPDGYVLHDVLTDLLKGRHMKYLLESLTGKTSKKIDSFDSLSLTQKQNRVDWIVDELRKMELVKGFSTFDSRLFAMKSADSVFDLLWCLVCHDIWFIWERSVFLQQQDEKQLISCPLSWTPPKPPEKTASKQSVNYLTGFGSSSIHQQPSEEDMTEKWTSRKALFERDEDMIETPDGKSDGLYPSPDVCIMRLVNAHLKMTKEGQKLVRGVLVLGELGDSRVLCALLNSFVPGTFTSEVLLNDRWTVNLVLQAASEMFRCPNPFNAEDFVTADVLAICAYLIFFFMCGYKYRQARAVIRRRELLLRQTFCANEDLVELKKNREEVTIKTMNRERHLEEEIRTCTAELETLESKYNTEDFLLWMKEVASVQEKVKAVVSEKSVQQYEIITVPGTMTINELLSSMMINLSLTSGVGFYEAKAKETITNDRVIIARNIETGKFFDDSKKQGKSGVGVRRAVGIPKRDVFEIQPSDYPTFELFFDSPSRNRLIRAGTRFLYKVFPGNNAAYQKMLLRSATMGDFDVIQKLVGFFEKDKAFVNSREKSTKNTPLHLACRQGHFNIVLFLLQHHADVNMENILGLTPIFLATESVRRRISMLLVEWNAEIYHRNRQGRTVIDVIKHPDLRDALIERYHIMKTICKAVIEGDLKLLREEVSRHHAGEKRFTALESRCINGSTVLHTAAYYGDHNIMKICLGEGVDPNLRDYVGAPPVHRAKDVPAIEILLKAGANINAIDQDMNTALHLNCYSDKKDTTDFSVLRKIIEMKVSLTSRNKRNLMPIHCAAMRGNTEMIQFLLNQDGKDEMRNALLAEDLLPPSLPHLAVANDHVLCARWLLEHEFEFKSGEGNMLLEKVLMEQVPCENYPMAVSFLIKAGASPMVVYPGGNTALHLVAMHPHMTDAIEVLVEYGANVDALNMNRCTPLFFATKADNVFGASALIRMGADLKVRNYQGQTAFDLINDIDAWIESGCFNEESVVRLKAYNLKEARNLIRSVTKKVRGVNISHTAPLPKFHGRSQSVPAILPPINDR